MTTKRRTQPKRVARKLSSSNVQPIKKETKDARDLRVLRQELAVLSGRSSPDMSTCHSLDKGDRDLLHQIQRRFLADGVSKTKDLLRNALPMVPKIDHPDLFEILSSIVELPIASAVTSVQARSESIESVQSDRIAKLLANYLTLKNREVLHPGCIWGSFRPGDFLGNADRVFEGAAPSKIHTMHLMIFATNRSTIDGYTDPGVNFGKASLVFYSRRLRFFDGMIEIIEMMSEWARHEPRRLSKHFRKELQESYEILMDYRSNEKFSKKP